jgi:15-hydroxyprostaglandin dehydrogenase (NAD)
LYFFGSFYKDNLLTSHSAFSPTQEAARRVFQKVHRAGKTKKKTRRCDQKELPWEYKLGPFPARQCSVRSKFSQKDSMGRLEGTTAVVTGAASGIGAAIALTLVREGGKVVLADINLQGATALAEKLNREKNEVVAVGVKCDVCKPEDIHIALTAAFTHFSRLDIVCNNAGVAEKASSYPFEESNWRRVVNVNLIGLIEGTQQACKLMKEKGQGGVIINTASLGGILPMPGVAIYAATKAGVINFTRSLAHLAESDNIRVNAICPTFTDTPILQPNLSELSEAMRKVNGRFLSAEEVAEGVLELILDKTKAGAVMRITVRNGRDYWNPNASKSLRHENSRL